MMRTILSIEIFLCFFLFSLFFYEWILNLTKKQEINLYARLIVSVRDVAGFESQERHANRGMEFVLRAQRCFPLSAIVMELIYGSNIFPDPRVECPSDRASASRNDQQFIE